MTKHTPGPWFIDGTTILQDIGPCLHIAYLHESDGTPLTQRTEANARLISAAPDYDQAARDAVETISKIISSINTGSTMLDPVQDLQNVVDDLRAAIDKAEGK